MTDRAAWLDARRLGIGGSDASAMVSCHPRHSLLSMYAIKTGALDDDGDSVRLRWGRRFEAAILDEYAEATGLEVWDQDRAVPERVAEVAPGVMMLRHPDIAVAIGNTDGIAVGDPRGLIVPDAKTVEAAPFRGWLRDGRPPLYYLVQLQHYMAITGIGIGVIAAFTGLSDPLYIYEVEHDPDFTARLLDAEDTFWRRYVARRQPPPADTSESSARALRALYPKDSGKAVQLTGPACSWAADFDDLTDEIKTLTERRDAAKTALIATLGDAAVGILPDGTGFTYKAGKSGRQLRRAGEKALRKYRTDDT